MNINAKLLIRPRAWRAAAAALGAALVLGVVAPPASAGTSGGTTASAAALPAPGSRTILDGWVSYTPGPSWTVVGEAERIERFRRDYDTVLAAEPRLQSLLHLRSGGSEIRLVRDMAFLDVADETAWRDQIAAAYVAPGAIPVQVDVGAAPHGPITRAFYTTETATRLVASTRFGAEYLAIVATFANGMTDAEVAATGTTLSSIRLNLEFEMPPLLQFHGGMAWFDVGGTRVVELDFDVPSTWTPVVPTPPGSAIVFRSPDGTATLDVSFAVDAATSTVQRVAGLVPQLGAGAQLDDTMSVDVPGGPFLLAAVRDTGIDTNGMAGLLLADAGSVDIEVVLQSTTALPEHGLLFSEIVQTLVLRHDESGIPLS